MTSGQPRYKEGAPPLRGVLAAAPAAAVQNMNFVRTLGKTRSRRQAQPRWAGEYTTLLNVASYGRRGCHKPRKRKCHRWTRPFREKHGPIGPPETRFARSSHAIPPQLPQAHTHTDPRKWFAACVACIGIAHGRRCLGLSLHAPIRACFLREQSWFGWAGSAT